MKKHSQPRYVRLAVRLLVAAVLVVLFSFKLRAHFTDSYAPEQWSVNRYGGNGGPDWFDPEEVDLSSGTTGSGTMARAELTVRSPVSGTFSFSFDWYEFGANSNFGWLSNGVFTSLSANDLGRATFEVKAGDTVGFRVTGAKGGAADEYAVVYLYDFSGPGQQMPIPTIDSEPEDQLLCPNVADSSAYFWVEARYAAEYQWQFNGRDLPGETNPDLYIEAPSAANIGRYRVKVSNALGTVFSREASLDVPRPIVVVTQPASQKVCLGQPLNLCVGIVDPDHLNYQWYFNGVEIEDAVDACYVVESFHPSYAGVYKVLVYNECDETWSSEATVGLNALLEIEGQPHTQTRLPGETSTFTVVHSGSGPFNYQWRRNGELVAGGNQPTLTIPSVGPPDQGSYTVEVRDQCGSVTSEAAQLSIVEDLPRLSISLAPSNMVLVRLSGPAGRVYVLEATTNLLSEGNVWLPLSTNSYCHDQVELYLPRTAELTLYRARMLSELAHAPTAPENLTSVISPAGDAVMISWNDLSSDESSFIIERAARSEAFSIIAVLDAGTTTFTDSSAGADGCFRYRVRAMNCAGISLPSNAAQICRIPGPTDLQASTSVVDQESSVVLTWMDHSASESEFIVERAVSGGGFEVIGLVPSDTTTFLDESIEELCYSYRVSARNSAIESAHSNPVTVCIVYPPEVPGPLSISLTSLGNVRIEWADNSDDETGFEIERSSDGESFSMIATAPANSDVAARIVDSNILGGRTYSYRVRAVKGDLRSDYSDSSTVTIPPTVSYAPSNLSLRVTSLGNVEATWTDNSDDEDRFELYRAIDGEGFAFKENVPAQAGQGSRASAVDDSVNDGVTYRFMVRAIRGGRPTSFSDPATITVPSRAPGALSLRVTSRGNVEAEWTDNSGDEERFELWKSTDGTSFSLKENVTAADGKGNRTSAVDDTVSLGRTYWYKVRAIRGGGVTAFSNIDVIAVPHTVSGSPSALTLRITSNGNVEAEWTDNTDDEVRYELWRSADGVNFAIEENVPEHSGTGRTSAVDTTVGGGRTYWYKVRAIRSFGPTEFSNVASIAVPSRVPSDLVLRVTSSGNVEAKWTDNTSDEIRFELYRSSDGINFSLEENVPPANGIHTRTSAVDTTVQPGKKYWYKVRAIRSSGITGFSNTESISVPR